MCTADWIAIGVVAGCILLGALLGFGKLLAFFTNKIFGKITALFVCYTFGGMIMSIGFVQDLLIKIASLWSSGDNFFLVFLTKIHPEVIIFYIILFIAVFWLLKLLALLAKAILEIKVMPLKIINKVGGALLLTATGILIGLLIFQIIAWVGGETAVNLLNDLHGSVFGLDKLFLNNPLLGLVNVVKG
ncbi:MAG: hypothetical protein J1G05_00360 [Clostridiales bacterium]|nr:hypothetical protein [Clostridiales bacterium]